MPKRKPKRAPPPGRAGGLRYARNPGVSSLLLVNPGKPAPTQRQVQKALAPLVKQVAEKVGKKMSEQQKKSAPKRKPPRRSQRHSAQVALPFGAAPVPVIAAVPSIQPVAPKRGGKASARGKNSRRSSGSAVAIDRAVEAAIKKRFPAYQTRKRPYRGDPESKRGLKTLDRDRRSILWNLRNGPPSARKWVLDKVPRMNPGGLGQMALGIGAFFGNRYLSHAASRLPGIKAAGTFAPVLTSGLLTLATHFATKKRPDLRTPLLWGSAISLADKLIEAAVLNFFPGASKFLGMGATEQHSLEPYEEPMGYLPAYQPMMNGMGMACYPGQHGMGFDVHEAMAGDGIGFDVHEAMADSDDGMGFDVREAVAGYLPPPESMGAYVPWPPGMGDEQNMDGMGAYIPTPPGANMPMAGLGANDPLGNKLIADTPQERMQDAAAFMFGGPLALAKLRGMRAMKRRQAMMAQRHAMMQGRMVAPPGGMMGGGHMAMPHINVYCPPYPHHRHSSMMRQPGMHPQMATPMRALPPHMPPTMPAMPPAPAAPMAQPVTVPAPPAAPSAMHGTGMAGAGGIFASND